MDAAESTNRTISAEYRTELRRLHDSFESFGAGSHLLLVAQIFRNLNLQSISDFGAGKMRLASELRKQFNLDFEYYPYDPAFPEYGEPKSADLVCCIEVLEHVELQFLPTILKLLAGITSKFAFLTVHCAESSLNLADGRNSHLIQEPISWWLPEISKHFDIQWLGKTGLDSFAVLCSPIGHTDMRIEKIDLYQSDSFVTHTLNFLSFMRAEVLRRRRRGHWRPK